MNEMVQRFAYQHLFVPEGRAEAIAAAMSNSLVVGLSGGVVQWEQPPTVPPWVIDWVGRLVQNTDAGTYGDVLRGVRPTGVSTASQHAQITAKAKQVFVTPMMQVNHAASLFLGNCARLVVLYKDPVTVTGFLPRSKGSRLERTIRGEDFQDNFQLDVEFTAIDPIEKAADAEQGMELLARNIIDWQTTARDYLHLTNMSEVEVRRWQETVANSPQAQQAIFAAVEAEWQRRLGLPAPSNGAQPTPTAVPQQGPVPMQPLGMP